jgi:hypothetical protein
MTGIRLLDRIHGECSKRIGEIVVGHGHLGHGSLCSVVGGIAAEAHCTFDGSVPDSGRTTGKINAVFRAGPRLRVKAATTID